MGIPRRVAAAHMLAKHVSSPQLLYFSPSIVMPGCEFSSSVTHVEPVRWVIHMTNGRTPACTSRAHLYELAGEHARPLRLGVIVVRSLTTESRLPVAARRPSTVVVPAKEKIAEVRVEGAFCC